MKKIKENFKIIFINSIILLLLIILLEIIFIFYHKNKINCLYILCDIKYKYENNLYDPFNNVTYERDKFGLRGRYKDVNKIDIIVVGGSTTDERLLNLDDTWVEKLENNFNLNQNIQIDVVNAGIDGQSSFGHIWNFNNWFKKIENLRFSYIIFYVGLNESANGTKFDLNSKDLQFLDKIKIIIKKNNGLIFRLYSEYQKYFTDKKINYGINISDKKFILNNKALSEKELSVTESFRNNLKKLHNLSLEYNSIPIFISQRSYRWRKKNNKIFSINENNFYLKEKLLSEEMMDYCDEKRLICVDLFKNLNLERNDTYDLQHLTPQGATKVADTIYDELKYKLKFNF